MHMIGKYMPIDADLDYPAKLEKSIETVCDTAGPSEAERKIEAVNSTLLNGNKAIDSQSLQDEEDGQPDAPVANGSQDAYQKFQDQKSLHLKKGR